MNILAAIVTVTNLGFTAWFDTDLKIPRLVEYDLEPNEVVKCPRYPMDFHEDPRVPGTSLDSAYRGSGYDRGHIAPAADFNWAEEALRETYRYTNIAPQAPSLNRGRWLDAETEVREMSKAGTTHVITFVVPGTNFIGEVNVPSEFHKFAIGPEGMKIWTYENK